MVKAAKFEHLLDVAKNQEMNVSFRIASRAILLAFSRDASIPRCASAPALPRLAADSRGGRLRAYPPSGVLPFRGLAAYAAPLAFLYPHPAAAYRVFVALYCRHWAALHGVSARGGPAPGMAALCRTFVELIEVRGLGGGLSGVGVQKGQSFYEEVICHVVNTFECFRVASSHEPGGRPRGGPPPGLPRTAGLGGGFPLVRSPLFLPVPYHDSPSIHTFPPAIPQQQTNPPKTNQRWSRMFSAFAGYLSPCETLLLWDRVIGYDSLLPLPVLAVSVMTFR